MDKCDRLRVGWLNGLGGVPREQKMLKGHLPRVIYRQVYYYTKTHPNGGGVADMVSVVWFPVSVFSNLHVLSLDRICAPEGRCKATWKREFELPWREAGPPNHRDDKVGSDQ